MSRVELIETNFMFDNGGEGVAKVSLGVSKNQLRHSNKD